MVRARARFRVVEIVSLGEGSGSVFEFGLCLGMFWG